LESTAIVVYMVTPDEEKQFIFQDPASKSDLPHSGAPPSIVYDAVGLDVDKDQNPTFVVLERPPAATQVMKGGTR